jgi:hypothetical protein
MMITLDQIKERLNRKPFQPFRIFLSDGSKHEVPHPEFAWAFGKRLFIGSTGKGNGYWPVEEIAVLHVTRIAALAPHKARK